MQLKSDGKSILANRKASMEGFTNRFKVNKIVIVTNGISSIRCSQIVVIAFVPYACCVITTHTLTSMAKVTEKLAAGFVIFRRAAAGNNEYLLLQTSYGKNHWTPPKGTFTK